MLDTKEEQKYKRLRKLGQELHAPTFEAFLTLEVFDKNGNIIQKHRQRSHSWVRNAYNLLFTQLAGKDMDDPTTFGGGKLNLKPTDGVVTNRNYPCCIVGAISADVLRSGDTPGATAPGYLAGAGVDAYGIQVGTGVTAESFEDYVLATKIANGSGSGQLAYIAHELHSVSYAALTLKDEIVRFFNNNSGGTVTINEVGLVYDGILTQSAKRVMNARDKLSSGVELPDTGQLKVTYTVQLTYPA